MRCLPGIALILLLVWGCNNSKKPATESNTKEAENYDSTYFFNGESLDGWEITNFGPQGPVEISSGSIVLGMGDGCTGITYKKEFPETNYEVSLEAKRVSGTDFFCGITFPVGKSSCSLIVGGWGGTVVGLSSIDGYDAAENETTLNMKFEKERWYKVRLRVTEDSINASVDSIKVVSFRHAGRKLSIRPEVQLSRPFGIASWQTTAALRNIRVIRTL